MVDLAGTAQQLLRSGKGILAADESNMSADKRLAQYAIETGEEMRQKYRELFLATPHSEDYLSGVILYDETLHQKTSEGVSFIELLLQKGIIPGIKVDEGLDAFPEGGEEFITKGLLGLPQRLARYKLEHKTGFTKWRAVIKIDGTRLPTAQAIVENAKRLARYAYDVQMAGMVPIVEPEVLLDGNHSRLRSREVLTQTLTAVIEALKDQHVDLSGTILKTAMAISGKDSGRVDSPEEVATDTVAVLLEVCPAELAGVVFLSGGQSTDQATKNLEAIEKEATAQNAPWPLTFSYARALQDEALHVWKGRDENVPAAREAFLARLKETASFTV
jgi:fructose-bisphosphate aldolase, class I